MIYLTMYSKIKTFINLKKKDIREYYSKYHNKFQLGPKYSTVLYGVIDVCFTGLMLWYAVTFKNFFSWGLRAYLFTYYLTFIITEIKKPYKDKETKK